MPLNAPAAQFPRFGPGSTFPPDFMSPPIPSTVPPHSNAAFSRVSYRPDPHLCIFGSMAPKPNDACKTPDAIAIVTDSNIPPLPIQADEDRTCGLPVSA